MSFQTHPILRAAPRFHLGAVVSFSLMLATTLALIAAALQGIGLVEWGLQ